jgi:hypothetical protein
MATMTRHLHLIVALTFGFLSGCGTFGSKSDNDGQQQTQQIPPDQNRQRQISEQMPPEDPRQQYLTNDFPLPSGISVPPGTIINIDETMISGLAQATTGFVVMESDYAPNILVNYYSREMVSNGWQPSGISRGQKNYISFIRTEKTGSTRVASFRITESKGIGGVFGKQGGSNIELFVGEAPSGRSP